MLMRLFDCLLRCPPVGRRARTASEQEMSTDVDEHDRAPEPDAADQRSQDEMAKLPGVDTRTARLLYEAGFTTVEDLRAASQADLMKIPGIGKATARKIKQALAGR
jgi:ERCC4-type nuclease